MVDPAQTTTLRYLPELSSVQFELFEVDPALLANLTSTGQLIIKSYQPPAMMTLPGSQEEHKEQARSAALSSQEATYKLKKSETSNTFLFAGLESGTIYKQTSVYVELEKA